MPAICGLIVLIRAAMPFHSDQGCTDIVSLLSLSKSKAGGASRWVSALAIHNELLSRGRLVRFLLFANDIHVKKHW